MSENLYIEWIGTKCYRGRPGQVEAWRISYEYRGHEYATGIGFARKQDAEMALRGLIAAGFNTPAKMWDEKEYELRKRIMCESLAW